jgi:hypothetical protein
VYFTYHIPFDPIAIAAQARLGHSQSADSSVGRWIAYVLGAYEGAVSADFDPNSEGGDGGYTNLGKASSLVFNETIRDASAAQPSDNEYNLSATAAHEIGHEFGISHMVPILNCGLMALDLPLLDPMFCPEAIRIIRMSTVPSSP